MEQVKESSHTDPLPPSFDTLVDTLVDAGMIEGKILRSPFFDDAAYDYNLLYPGQMVPDEADGPLVIEKKGRFRATLLSMVGYVQYG